MIPRFHCPIPLSPGALVELPEAVAHHALKVLRMKSGDALVLFDGTGGEWHATLKIGADRTARALIGAFDDVERESPLSVTLAQALPAGDKMDWVVEKCVELGVAAIQPVRATRSVIRLSPERMARRVAHWNAIAVAACEQCGRNRVPKVMPVLDLPQYLAQAQAQNACRLLLAPQGENTLCTLARPQAPLSVLIGPEGGWDEWEIAAAHAAGFSAVRLGPRVLRTETAGTALLAALQVLWGDY
ncbi:MAG: 16S rRNA (uracil(1498)-N(3))-methyltransferase [Rhodocyclaceae bacterium]